jgi:cell division protein FtsQ
VGQPRPSRSWRGRARLFARLGILAATCGAIGIAAYDAVARNGALRVNDIRVSGLSRLAPSDIEALISGVRRASILTVRLDDVRARLLESPWIEDANVRRVLPQAIELTVVERNPIGVARFPSGLFLIDGSGAIVDRFGPKYADMNLPIVDGFEAMPRPGIRVEPARAHLATKLLRALGEHPDLLRRLSQVDVSDDRNAVAMLEGDPALLHLGHERFAERLQAYLDMAPALRERVQAIDYIDLRFEQRVYLRPVMAKANKFIGTKKDGAAPAAEGETDPGPDPGLADEVAPPREPAQ